MLDAEAAPFSTRLTILEQNHKTLLETVQKLAVLQTDQAEMQAAEHAQTRKEITSLAGKFAEAGKPNFSVIIAACSFLLLLTASVMSPLLFQITENKQSLAKVQDAFYHHQTMDAHPVATAILEEREKAASRETELRETLELSRHALLENKIDNLKSLR